MILSESAPHVLRSNLDGLDRRLLPTLTSNAINTI